MQLRDNIPGIVYPGHWGFFGGHLEPEETPEVGLLRELHEEISYRPDTVSWFKQDVNDRIIRYIFHAPLTVELDQLVLGEGWDLGLVTPREIEQGQAYSSQAKQFCPLGEPHQRILLEFMAQEHCWHDYAN